MYMCIYVHDVHTYVHYVHMYVCIYDICMYTYICMYYIHSYVHTYLCVGIFTQFTYIPNKELIHMACKLVTLGYGLLM